MSAKFPRTNPEIKWEVPHGRDIANLALTKGGIDPRTHFRLIPEHLKGMAGKIKHLTLLLEAEIRAYDAALSKCEVSEIRRIQADERDAKEDAQLTRIEKGRKKIIKSYRGGDKILAKQDGLTNSERKAKAFNEFLLMCQEQGMELPESIRKNIESTVEETKKKFGSNF
jgi:hypothetical protein